MATYMECKIKGGRQPTPPFWVKEREHREKKRQGKKSEGGGAYRMTFGQGKKVFSNCTEKVAEKRKG